MTNAVIFQNQGLLDLRFITTFGASVKETTNPIGFFGTGLKYALAVLAREKAEVIIAIGLDRYQLEVASDSLRGKDFNFIQLRNMNDGTITQLPFTTELGKKWELWQAYRELYCNCLDENGSIYDSTSELKCFSDQTTILVLLPAFYELHLNRDQIILDPSKRVLLFKSPLLEIYQRRSGDPDDGKYIFYKGMRAHKLEHQSNYVYNVLRNCELTEDRTLKYEWQWKRDTIAASFSSYQGDVPQDLLRKVLMPDEASLEWQLDYDLMGEPRSEFLDMVAKLRLIHFSAINRTALRVYEKHRQRAINHTDRVDLTDREAAMLIEAKLFLTSAFQCLWDDVEVHVVQMDEKLFGCVKDEQIFLNKIAFRKGMRQLVVTLWEEYIHLKHGLDDYTRQFQDYIMEHAVAQAELNQGEAY